MSVKPAPITVGLRVSDVQAARDFYQKLGFEEVMSVPGEDGKLLFSNLHCGSSSLVIGVLEGLPYPETDREKDIKKGPRGLGVKIGLEVEDLDAMYQIFVDADCEVTTEPMEEAWGDRLFTALDPYGYEWQITHATKIMTFEEMKKAAQENWS